jgi:quinoprotein glucose dehydrogenase
MSFLMTSLSLVLGLFGLTLALGGGVLLLHAGSAYFLLAGLALLLNAVLLWRRSARAIGLFAAILALSLAWALWEAQGLDWWPLASRLGVYVVIGLLLLLPAVHRAIAVPLAPTETGSRLLTRSRTALGLVLLATLVVSLLAYMRDPAATVGALPTEAATTTPNLGASLPDGEWHAYGRTGFGQRYTPLHQIQASNVRQLQLVWQYRTGDVRGHVGDPEETTYEVTPLKIDNKLILCTPHQVAIALDATTGQQLWRYEPKLREPLAVQHMTCRGLSYQAHSTPPAQALQLSDDPLATTLGQPIAAKLGPTDAACSAKLFLPTADGRVIALNPETGHVCSQFGQGTGQINLYQHMPNANPGSYYSTSPPVVAGGLLLVAGTVLDNASTKEESGVIRAFDVETGALVWSWDSGNPDSTAPLAAGQSYTPNSPNSWSVASVDEQLGLAYFPMGNQPPDQWGGARSPASERHSSAVVALETATGRLRWAFQTVHHDLWDYDVPAQPVLIDLQIGGTNVPALVQPTKQGELFVLNRATGEPLLPVTEMPAPQGAATGDRTAPTQPRSTISFEPAMLHERDMWGATLVDQLLCRIAFRGLRYEGRFTPPSEQGSLIHPGNFGVFNWGSIAVDPVRQIAFATPTYLPFTSQLVPRHDNTTLLVGQPPKNGLPALNENFGAPYAARMAAFLSPLGIPCSEPPWGTVAGVDLRTGQIAWRHRNGTVRDASALPVWFKMGVPNIGGPILTASGLGFLSSAMDYYLRAYDVRTGEQLWEDRLPAGAQATPMSYEGADGRQYLLVVAGGHGSTGTKPGDYIRAYALPR